MMDVVVIAVLGWMDAQDLSNDRWCQSMNGSVQRLLIFVVLVVCVILVVVVVGFLACYLILVFAFVRLDG